MRRVTALVAAMLVLVALQSSRGNLLTNPGFEGSGGWGLGGGGGTWNTNLSDSAQAHSGTKSYSASWSGVPVWNAGVANQTFDVLAGQTLDASAYVKIDSINSAQTYLETIFYDASWSQLPDETKFQSTKLSSVADWTEMSLTGIVSNNAAHARLQLVVQATDNNSSGSVFFDDVNAVPEPTTAAMLGVAMAGLVVLRRRKM